LGRKIINFLIFFKTFFSNFPPSKKVFPKSAKKKVEFGKTFLEGGKFEKKVKKKTKITNQEIHM